MTKACARTTERVPARPGGEVGADPVHGGARARPRGRPLSAPERRRAPGPVRGRAARRRRRRRASSASSTGVPQPAGSVRRWMPGAVDQPGADAEPAGRVVVAGDHHRGHAEVGEPVQGVVEQLDGGERRHGPVVDVARDEHRVDLALARPWRRGGRGRRAWASSRLTRWKRPAQMPVGRVQKSHDPRRRNGAGRTSRGLSAVHERPSQTVAVRLAAQSPGAPCPRWRRPARRGRRRRRRPAARSRW